MEKTLDSKKKGLGRGLGSLLGGAPSQHNMDTQNMTSHDNLDSQKSALTIQMSSQNVSSQNLTTQNVPSINDQERIWQVPIEKLKSGEFQPRQHFDKAALEELAQSIREKGILQPILARKLKDGTFEIVAGERRWRAAQLAEKKSVPVILQDLNDKATLEIAIIENVQRADLNPIEEAEAYQRLVDEFKLSHQQIAEKVGKERATVSNAIRLLGLAPVVRQMLLDGKISSGHAKVLLSVKEAAAQSNLGNKVIQKGLSVRALEALLKEPDESRPAKMEVSSELRVVQSKLQSYFGSKVEVKGQENSGQLVIHFFSRDELSTLLEKLMG